MNKNIQQNQRENAIRQPIPTHAGVERIERAFENLVERVEASNERLQRAILRQRLSLDDGFEFENAAASQALPPAGRSPQPAADGQTEEQQAHWAEIKAWADAHKDKPVEEITDPHEAHKRIWLDSVNKTVVSDH